MKRVLVPLARGAEELEAVTVIDVLVRAGAEVVTASIESELQVTCSRGVRLVAQCHLSEVVDQEFDLIVLPGGAEGAQRLSDHPELADLLRRQKESGRLLAAICAAPALVLGRHGLLQESRATCYPSFRDRLHAKEHLNQAVVTEGNLITSQGPGTAMAFALELAQRLFGEERRSEVAQGLLF